jgi:hypothetical protein
MKTNYVSIGLENYQVYQVIKEEYLKRQFIFENLENKGAEMGFTISIDKGIVYDIFHSHEIGNDIYRDWQNS